LIACQAKNKALQRVLKGSNEKITCLYGAAASPAVTYAENFDLKNGGLRLEIPILEMFILKY